MLQELKTRGDGTFASKSLTTVERAPGGKLISRFSVFF